MPVRRSTRQKRKLVDKDEKYSMLKHSAPFKKTPSPEPELFFEEAADQICRELGLDSDEETPTPEPENVVEAATPEPPAPVLGDIGYSPENGSVDDPITIDFNVDDDVVNRMLDRHVLPSTHTPLIANGSSPVIMTENQRIALRSMGASENELNMAVTEQAVDDLFFNYGNRPTQTQIDYLRGRGVSDAEVFGIPNRDTATVLIGKIKATRPATSSQVRYLRRLYARDRITSPLPPDLREGEASRLITRIQAERPTTDRQRALLLSYGVPDERIPNLYAAANVAVNDVLLKQSHAQVLE